ncbi:MAG TPA: signal peptidase II [Solirubrobacterales bacterium]
MSRGAAWRGALATCALVLIADQATKQAAIDALLGQPAKDLPLGFQLDYVTNTGIAFGLFDDGEAFVILVTLAALALLVGWFASDPTRPNLWLATGLLAGGALGNLADRLRDGAVTDFIDPPSWPAFNVADVAITAGVVILLLTHMLPQRQ